MGNANDLRAARLLALGYAIASGIPNSWMVLTPEMCLEPIRPLACDMSRSSTTPSGKSPRIDRRKHTPRGDQLNPRPGSWAVSKGLSTSTASSRERMHGPVAILIRYVQQRSRTDRLRMLQDLVNYPRGWSQLIQQRGSRVETRASSRRLFRMAPPRIFTRPFSKAVELGSCIHRAAGSRQSRAPVQGLTMGSIIAIKGLPILLHTWNPNNSVISSLLYAFAPAILSLVSISNPRLLVAGCPERSGFVT